MATSQRRRGIILGYSNIVVRKIVNLLYTPMLLAFVGQGDYGVFQTANSFIFSLTLLSFGFSGAYVRFYTQRMAEGDVQGTRVLNGMYLLLYVAISVLAVGIGFFFAANAHVIFAGSFTADEVDLAGVLGIFERVDREADMSSRFDTLCNLFGAERCRARYGDFNMHCMDWGVFESSLDELRIFSRDWLESALAGEAVCD